MVYTVKALSAYAENNSIERYKTMKRITALIMTVALCLGIFCACGKSEEFVIGITYFEPMNYFDDSNKPKSNKKLDFSVIGGPAYSSDTKLSLGLIGAALYTTGNPIDTITSESNASLYTEVSITGYYNIGLRGVHFTPADRWRFNYKASFSSMPSSELMT